MPWRRGLVIYDYFPIIIYSDIYYKGKNKLITKCVYIIICLQLITGCIPFPTSGKRILLHDDKDSNVSLILDNQGLRPKTVVMTIFIDNIGVFKHQKVKHKPRTIYQADFRLNFGYHKITVKIENLNIEAENIFKVTDESLFLIIIYQNPKEGDPELTIEQRSFGYGFA
jgi:hypothetical protein